MYPSPRLETRAAPNTNKVYASAAEAISDIRDGARLVFGGMGGAWNVPVGLIQALHEKGSRGLTVMCCSLGSLPGGGLDLAERGQISKLLASFGVLGGARTLVADRVASGEIEFELVPMGLLCERFKAGASGIPAFYTSTGVGTIVERGKEKRVFGGKEYTLETALRADYGFILAQKADTLGNLVFHGAARNFNPIFAMASDVTIVEAEEIVAAGELDPDEIHTPGIYVDRIVKCEANRHALAMDYLRRAPLSQRMATGTPIARHGKVGLSKELIAMRVAKEIGNDRWVNLGIGIPAFVSQFISDSVNFHTEVGTLAYGRLVRSEDEIDIDIYGASGEFLVPKPGTSFVSSLDAFTIAKGGRVDTVVLGAYQVSEKGDIANIWSPEMGVPGAGGAMDLAASEARLIVAMEHTAKNGEPKLLKECSYPLTARSRVSLIVTDLAVVVVTSDGFLVTEIAPNWSVAEVQALTGANLRVSPNLKEIEL